MRRACAGCPLSRSRSLSARRRGARCQAATVVPPPLCIVRRRDPSHAGQTAELPLCFGVGKKLSRRLLACTCPPWWVSFGEQGRVNSRKRRRTAASNENARQSAISTISARAFIFGARLRGGEGTGGVKRKRRDRQILKRAQIAFSARKGVPRRLAGNRFLASREGPRSGPMPA